MLTSVLLVCFWSTCYCAVSRINLTDGGPEVSRIVYGTLHLGEIGTAQNVLVVIEKAISFGITTFDFSDVYGSHYAANIALFGQALNLKPGLRQQIQIIAKMNVHNGYDSSKDHLEQVFSDYLNLLNTDYIDVVLLHRQDYLMDVVEVAQAFREWKSAGKALYFGTSNHDQNSFLNLAQYVPLVTNEIEVSVWAPETICPIGSGAVSPNTYWTNNGLVDFHYRLNSSVLSWGPLGGDPYGGINRLFKTTGARQTKIIQALHSVGTQIGESEPDIVALAWLLKHPAKIVPIIGTTNAERISNQTRAEGVAQKMTRSQWYDIARAVGVPLP